MADISTLKEVVVECFAPYDDHRWVDIGKVGGAGDSDLGDDGSDDDNCEALYHCD